MKYKRKFVYQPDSKTPVLEIIENGDLFQVTKTYKDGHTVSLFLSAIELDRLRVGISLTLDLTHAEHEQENRKK